VRGFVDAGPLYSGGIHINGEKYMCIKADDRSIYGKLVRLVHISTCRQISYLTAKLQGKHGICCVKTKQTILVTHYPETVQPGEAATVVEKLADYLISLTY